MRRADQALELASLRLAAQLSPAAGGEREHLAGAVELTGVVQDRAESGSDDCDPLNPTRTTEKRPRLFDPRAGTVALSPAKLKQGEVPLRIGDAVHVPQRDVDGERLLEERASR